jgi:outer membrane protein assembly factor BamA
MNRARPCLLPDPVQKEIKDMLRDAGPVSARMLQKIRDRVQKWYQDEGYACAQVVNFGNLNTKNVVCEVVEGDITKLDIQFLDKLGNVCEGNTQLPIIYREMPPQVCFMLLFLSFYVVTLVLLWNILLYSWWSFLSVLKF